MRSKPGAGDSNPWTLLVDFDGTVTDVDVTDALLERFALPGWREIERQWREGQIGSRECMGRQIALLDASRPQIDAYLEAVGIDPAFAEFVATAQRAGHELKIVSDGLDYVIRTLLRRLPLPSFPVVANKLVRIAARRWRLDFPHADEACVGASGNCKCRLTRCGAPDLRRRVLAIGDGASDFCVAARADWVFAKGRLREYCLTHAIPHHRIANFGEALRLLPLLTGTAPIGDLPLAQPELQLNA
jgi:2,3-diketo-5-methylthio-1-phosphopentane phosphatase